MSNGSATATFERSNRSRPREGGAGRLAPMVGMVVTISPSFSLYRMVVLPAASSPTIKILTRGGEGKREGGATRQRSRRACRAGRGDKCRPHAPSRRHRAGVKRARGGLRPRATGAPRAVGGERRSERPGSGGGSPRFRPSGPADPPERGVGQEPPRADLRQPCCVRRGRGKGASSFLPLRSTHRISFLEKSFVKSFPMDSPISRGGGRSGATAFYVQGNAAIKILRSIWRTLVR